MSFPLRLSELSNVREPNVNLFTETEKLLSCGVQLVSTLRRQARCFVGGTRDFPDLKINANIYFGTY